eukprot:TRINITY_DN39342_c0_g1_i1.p1 TRINITY_DN39342_c0_g1~~TRINITY_DN39342_c0_g1_i1.p1  ORF type:complete len:490 (-),score=134.88 TRINITY_DN39342_c0_g1_i1:109-1578(-)
MAALQQLLDRCSAAKAELSRSSMTPEVKAAISKIQCAALLHEIRCVVDALLPAEKVDLVGGITSAAFAPADTNALVSCVAAKSMAAVQQRRSMQDFSKLRDWFTEQDWMQMKGAPSMDAKRDIVFRRAMSLGCSCPTENSKMEWAALLAELHSGSDKNQIFQAIRAEWKRAVRVTEKPEWHLSCLPATFEELPQELREKAYGAGVPMDCQVDVQWSLKKCRNRSKVVPTLGLGGQDLSLGQGLQMFANCMMETMKSMQQQQVVMAQRQDSMLQALAIGAAPGNDATSRAEKRQRIALESHGAPAKPEQSATAKLPALCDGDASKETGCVVEVGSTSSREDAADGDKHIEPLSDVSSFLDMLTERKKETAAKTKKADVGESADVAAASPKKTAKPATRTKRSTAVTKAKPAAKKSATAKSGSTKKSTSTKASSANKPTFSVEKTRSQVQCRNPAAKAGEKKNWSIKFGKGTRHTEASARAEAERWVASFK